MIDLSGSEAIFHGSLGNRRVRQLRYYCFIIRAGDSPVNGNIAQGLSSAAWRYVRHRQRPALLEARNARADRESHRK